MPSKRGDKWLARPKINGKHVHLGTFDTKREAKQAEDEYRVRRSRHVSDVTVKELQDRWLKEWGEDRWKDATKVQNEWRTRVFVEQFGSRKAASITVPEAHHFCATHRTSAMPLGAMFSYAQRLGVVVGNPFSKVREPKKPNEVRPGRGALLVDEVYELAGLADKQWLSALVVFAAFTGLRRGEVLALRWDDLGDDKLWVRRAVSPMTGLLDTPKNGLEREVFFPRQARDAVMGMPRRADSVYVFPAPGGKHMYPVAFARVWEPLRERFHEKLPEGHWLAERRERQRVLRDAEPDPRKRLSIDQGWLKFHELRHTCATMLVEAGVDDRDVAAQLGHTDGGDLVRRVYGHPSRDASLGRVAAGFARVEGERPVLRKVEGGRAS